MVVMVVVMVVVVEAIHKEEEEEEVQQHGTTPGERKTHSHTASAQQRVCVGQREEHPEQMERHFCRERRQRSNRNNDNRKRNNCSSSSNLKNCSPRPRVQAFQGLCR